uniref:CC chemokine SCYA115 n=1 Tax=Epinephelus coioides TaxID=94232 RepID=A0A8E4BP49_EPICO|nr:CC chemokine SCYA115 [Epinephelus coioides]
MHFSISCGLSFMCVTALFFLPAQGKFECPNLSPLVTAAGSKLIDIHFNCCETVFTAHIREHVKDCYEQKAMCKIHAYILKGNSGRCYCVDPDASWLPERLKRLKTRGINCTVL